MKELARPTVLIDAKSGDLDLIYDLQEPKGPHGNLAAILRDHSRNGANGRLRSTPEDNDLKAGNDLEAIAEWLKSKAVSCSPATVRAYRREAERLLRWAWFQHHVAISDLRDADFSAYHTFLRNPTPKDLWVSRRNYRRSHPGWRMFQKPMTKANAAYVFTILNELFNWLTAKGYWRRNPIQADRDKRKKPKTRDAAARSALPPSVWDEILEAVESMPQATQKHKAEYERARYIFSLLYTMGLRLGDLGTNSMAAFRPRTRNEKTQWWWAGFGKGGKQADIPVPPDALEALKRYRRSLGFPALPEPGEDLGMVMSLDGKTAIGSDRIYRIVQSVIAAAHARARDKHLVGKGSLSAHDIEQLRHASTHWLRHTNITELLAAGVPLDVAQKLARHSDPRTTSGYNSVERDRLYEAATSLTLRWPSMPK